GLRLAHDVDGGSGDRCGHAALAPLGHHVAVHVVDLGRAALGHVLPHRGAPVASAGRGRREHPIQGVVDVMAVSGGPLLGGRAVELRHLVDERPAAARGFGAQEEREPRWIVIARPTSLEAISVDPRPDMACTGLPVAFAQSLAQRSPQRLSVTSEPSTTLSISATSLARAVILPSCSPTRNTSWPVP